MYTRRTPNIGNCVRHKQVAVCILLAENYIPRTAGDDVRKNHFAHRGGWKAASKKVALLFVAWEKEPTQHDNARRATSFISSNKRFSIKHLYSLEWCVHCVQKSKIRTTNHFRSAVLLTFALFGTPQMAHRVYTKRGHGRRCKKKYLIIIWQRNYCYRFHWTSDEKVFGRWPFSPFSLSLSLSYSFILRCIA